MREALITARLEHPGIVPVHEAGRWPDGTPFYAMKLVAGRPLCDLLAERETVDARLTLLHHVIAVADAIAYAHGRNIIHRDLKPGNVIVGDFGETVVIDWGLAKDLSGGEDSTTGESGSPGASRDDGLTSAGAILGTPAYMSPEQRRGAPVDQRADVYAIGAMLWELCSLDKLPLIGTGQHSRILQRSGIDRDLITIIEKAIAPDPTRRYSSAGALTADLKAFKTGARIAARSYSLFGMLAHWARRYRTLASFVSSTLVIAAFIGILYVRSIAAERDRTNDALQRVEATKNELVLEHAALLLHSDPTAALSALGGYHGVNTSERTQLAQTSVSGVAATGAATRIEHNFAPSTGRQERAAQIAADALGRGTAAYALSPDIGIITSLEWSSSALWAHGTDAKLIEWQPGQKKLGQELSLAPFSYSSTDAHRQLLAYQGSDTVIRLRNLQTGHEIELGRLNGTPWALVVSPMGRYVAAAGSTGDVVLWDSSARRLQSHSRPPGVYQALRFSPDSSMLAACGRDGRLVIWSVITGIPVTNGQCDGLANIDYEFSQDSKFLVIGYRSGDIDQIRLQNERVTAEDKMSLSIAHGKITEIMPGPGTYVFIGTDTGELLRYNLGSTRVTWRSQLTSSIVRAIYNRTYDLIFAGCSDGRIAMITGNGGSVGALQGHISRVSALSLSEDSRWLASGSADSTIRVWSLPVPAVHAVQLASAPLFSAKFSPDGELVASEAQDGTVSICVTKTQECTTTVAHQSLASGLAWRHDGTALASTGWDGRLRIWSRFSNDSKYIQLSAESGAAYLHKYLKHDRSLLLWFRGKNWEIRQTEGHEFAPLVVFDPRSSVSLSADGAILAVTTTTGLLSIWDTAQATPQLLSTVPLGHMERSAPSVSLSSSGRFAAVQFASGLLYLVSISARGEATLKVVPNMGTGLPWLTSFSPDEQDVAISYSDGRIVTLRMTTTKENSHHPLTEAAAGLWMGTRHLVGWTRSGYVWIYDRVSDAQCVTHIERDATTGGSVSPNEEDIAIAGESGRLHFFKISQCRWSTAHRKAG